MDQDGVGDSGVSPRLLSLITDFANVFADNKEQVMLESVQTSNGFEIILTVAAGDVSHISGYKGRTLEALHLIVQAVAVRTKTRLLLSLKSND